MAHSKQVIVALRSISEPDLAARLERCMTARPIPAQWRRLAIHLPFHRVRMVPPGDDPWMVAWQV